MRYNSIPNKGTATEKYKANNLVWQKHGIHEEYFNHLLVRAQGRSTCPPVQTRPHKQIITNMTGEGCGSAEQL